MTNVFVYEINESRTEIGIIKVIKLRRAFIQVLCESTGTKLVFFLHQT